jgi:hypothetical protein
MTAFLNSEEGRAMQARMAEMAEKQEEITKQAELAISKILTPAEKKKFNSFLGAEFDLMKLLQPRQRDRGDRRGEGGDRGRDGRAASERDRVNQGDTGRPAAVEEEASPPAETEPTPPARPRPRIRGGGTASAKSAG